MSNRAKILPLPPKFHKGRAQGRGDSPAFDPMSRPSRSFLLASWPRRLKPQLSRQVGRALGLVLLVILGWWLYRAMGLHQLPDVMPVTLLYWLHDYPWLYLKGRVYHHFHPWSWVWVMTLTLMCTYLLCCFIRTAPLSRRLHLFAICGLLRHNLCHKILMQSVDLYARFGIAPGMLAACQEKILDERRERLWTNSRDRSRIGAWNSLATAIDTYLRWALLCDPSREGAYKAFLQWRRTYTLFCVLPAPLNQTAKFRVLAAALAVQAQPLLLACCQSDNAAALAQRAQTDARSEHALAQDLLQALALEHPQLVDAAGFPALHSVLDLATHVASRRDQLLAWVQFLERDLETRAGSKPAGICSNGAHLELWAVLSLDVSLHQARLGGDPNLAFAYVDTLECLSLLLSLHPSPPKELRDLLERVPDSDDYRSFACWLRLDPDYQTKATPPGHLLINQEDFLWDHRQRTIGDLAACFDDTHLGQGA